MAKREKRTSLKLCSLEDGRELFSIEWTTTPGSLTKIKRPDGEEFDVLLSIREEANTKAKRATLRAALMEAVGVLDDLERKPSKASAAKKRAAKSRAA